MRDDLIGLGKRVRIYVGTHLTAPEGHQPLAYDILSLLNREGAAGATLFRAVAGFGAHGKLHTARLVDVSPDLPLVIEWIDGPERVQRLLPRIQEMVTAGVITVEDIEIVKYTHRAPRSLPPDQVGEVMTRGVMTVHPETPLGEVVRILVAGALRSVLVVDAAGLLQGIITNRDLVERGGVPARLDLLARLRPEALERELDGSSARERTASSVMTRNVVSVRADAPLTTAADLMITRGIKRLPVVDEQSQLIGVISRVDLLRTVGEDFHLREQPVNVSARTVGELARHEVPIVGPDAGIGEVIDAVTATRLNRAIVVDRERRVLGVIRDAEVLARLDPGHQRGVLGALMGRTDSPTDTPAKAHDVMIAPFPTIEASASIEEAARRMTDERLKVLPVVDLDGRLVGAVDRADVFRSLREGT